MAIENKTLVLDLVEWLCERPRPYAEVMDAWRTSCPRLSIWEDALEHGLVAPGATVRATEAGRAFLATERPVTTRAIAGAT